MSDANDLDSSFQVRLDARGLGDAESLSRAFLVSTFYCQAPQHPGFLATPTSTGPVIAVFTSETGLTRHRGPCRWFSTSGADLLATAPVGHRFVIDPGSRRQLIVDPARFLGLASGPPGVGGRGVGQHLLIAAATSDRLDGTGRSQVVFPAVHDLSPLVRRLLEP